MLRCVYSNLPAHDSYCCICVYWAHTSRPLLLRLWSFLLQCGSLVQGIPFTFSQSPCRCTHKWHHIKAPSLCMCVSLCTLTCQSCLCVVVAHVCQQLAYHFEASIPHVALCIAHRWLKGQRCCPHEAMVLPT